MSESGQHATGRQRNRRGEGSLLREDILSAAGRILAGGGEAALTIRAVTRAAGIAPQSFYLQFATLGELLLALYGAGHDELYRQLATAVESAGGDARNRVSCLAKAYIDFARREPGLYRMLFDSPGELHPEWDAENLPGSRSFGLVRDSVAQLRAEAVGDAENLFAVAAATWAQLHGVASLGINRPTFPWPDVDILVERVIAGAAAE